MSYKFYFQKQRAKRRDRFNLARMGARRMYYEQGREQLIQSTLDKDYHNLNRQQVVEKLDDMLPLINMTEEQDEEQ